MNHTAESIIKSARLRSEFYQKIRSFFSTRAALEVETPILSQGISLDAHIDIFKTSFRSSHSPGAQSIEYYLQTSPEYHMKRLLALGFPDIYQIIKVFRNGEYGRIHNPEFTLLEWYRRDFTMQQLMDEVCALLTDLIGNNPYSKITYQNLFKQYAGIDPLVSTEAELFSFCHRADLHPPHDATTTDLLQFILTFAIEPHLPMDEYIFVYEYPVEQALLATVSEKDPRVSNRFECYYQTLELGNGYHELVAWEENYHRLLKENQKRESSNKEKLPLDMRFLTSLKSGCPQCAGVALGLDRIFLCMLNKKNIKDILLFNWEAA